MTKVIKIIAADDHQIFLDGICSLCARYDHLEMLATYNNRDDLLEGLSTHTPDVLLLDLAMPGKSVEQTLRQVESDFPNIKILALTMSADAVLAKRLLSIGLAGYVMKDSAFEDLVRAIEELMQGGQFISAALVEEIRRLEKMPALHNLTDQEIAVLKGAADSKSNKEIAICLQLSERTVRFHMSNCFIKLKVKNRGGAIAEAYKRAVF